MNGFEWCLAAAVGFLIVYCLAPWDRYGGLRITMAVLAAVALLLAVLIGNGVLAAAH